MSAKSKTTNYGLPIYNDNDTLNVLNDFNSAMKNIDKNLKSVELSALNADSKTENNSASIENLKQSVEMLRDLIANGDDVDLSIITTIQENLATLEQSIEVLEQEQATQNTNIEGLQTKTDATNVQLQATTNLCNDLDATVGRLMGNIPNISHQRFDDFSVNSSSFGQVENTYCDVCMINLGDYEKVDYSINIKTEFRETTNKIVFSINSGQGIPNPNGTPALSVNVIDSSGYIVLCGGGATNTRDGSYVLLLNDNVLQGATYWLQIDFTSHRLI